MNIQTVGIILRPSTPELKDIFDYHEWASSDSCCNISDDLLVCYQDGNEHSKFQIEEDWMWFKIKSGENILDYNEKANDFVEDETGIILYTKKVVDETTATKKPSIEDMLDRSLQDLCPELEKFYSALINELEEIGNLGKIETVDQSDLYKIALDYFERKQNKFNKLNKKLIDDENIYRNGTRRRRTIIVSILQRYIRIQFHDSYKHIDTAFETLMPKHNKFKLT
jgi:hypothetical protein